MGFAAPYAYAEAGTGRSTTFHGLPLTSGFSGGTLLVLAQSFLLSFSGGSFSRSFVLHSVIILSRSFSIVK